MYEFLDRLINVAMPRIRDFHGISKKSFDKDGNYSLGIVEQSIFPELSFEETQTLHGLQVTFVISGSDKTYSRALLEKFGLPFEKIEVRGHEEAPRVVVEVESLEEATPEETDGTVDEPDEAKVNEVQEDK